MKVEGSCHCGQIRYEAEVDPDKVVICHCTDCQMLSGSAFRTVVPTNAGTFKLLSGKPKSYVKTAESGNKRLQTFCPECGTPIYSGPVGDQGRVVGLRVGTIRQCDRLIPSEQWWFRSAQGWIENVPAIRRRDKQPAFDPQGGFSR